MFSFFFNQKTAYEMRFSYWSSDVCSSDLCPPTTSRRCSTTPTWGSRRWCEVTTCSAPRPGRPTWPTCSAGHGRPGRTCPLWSEPTAMARPSRSEERRGGKESVRTGRYGGTTKHRKKQHHHTKKTTH